MATFAKNPCVMKRILFLLFTVFFAFNVFAQDHLTFKGIPIDGTRIQFVSKLKAKGFKEISNPYLDSHLSLLEGEFIGRNSKVYVVTKSNLVGKVHCEFEFGKDWDNIVNFYTYCKSLYSKKYGEPCVNSEKMPENYQHSGLVFWGIKNGEVEYTSMFKTDLGYIVLKIDSSDGVSGTLFIAYEDKKNFYVESEKSDLDDI